MMKLTATEFSINPTGIKLSAFGKTEFSQKESVNEINQLLDFIFPLTF